MTYYCKDCAKMQTSVSPKWGDEYYCEKDGKYYPENKPACYSFVKKPDKGYKRSGCYITTMICNLLGYDDDCLVLNNLRDLRELYLKQNEEGIRILQEYDQIGPIISNLIQNESKEYVTVIYERFLVPCATFAMAKLYPQATLIYQTMFEELKSRYGLLNLPVDYAKDTPKELLGKGRIRNRFSKENNKVTNKK